MDGFEDGHAVVISKDEVKFFVHNDVLHFMIFACFKFVDRHFSLFGEDDLDLLLCELWPFD